ncbi:MAG: formylglycine-generating enzyme family protein [Candidatus Aminicenantes bacterium]|nr:formylglycine-generating enzyme family protein [Candidatus Aminicenantes bacterium]
MRIDPLIRSDIIGPLVKNMHLIEGGSFLMGASSGESEESPVHNVLLDPFYIGKYEVTQKEWKSIMGTAPWKGVRYVIEGDDFPAVQVNYYEARGFSEKISIITGRNFRLPTEAEWEYCCRAGTKTTYYHGSLKRNLGKYAWFYENAFKETIMHPLEVGLKESNKWGLYDMLGNVYEWCSDWFSNTYYNRSPVNNPKGPKYGSHRVARGGDWARTDHFIRSAARRCYSPHFRDASIGFRLAMDPPDGS